MTQPASAPCTCLTDNRYGPQPSIPVRFHGELAAACRAHGGMVEAYYDEGGVQLHVGHVLDVLAALPAESVNCVMSSPP